MTRGSRARRFALLALAIPALALAAACDDNDTDILDATPAPTAEATTPTPSPTPTAEPASTPTPAPEGDAQAEVDPLVHIVTEGDLAPFLVDADGMTLYLFTVDEPGQSNCEGACVENWPPLTVDSEDDLAAGEGVNGTLGVIERADDGSLQVTYNGWPLYYWVADGAPGDTTGHEVNDVWFVVAPDVDPLGDASSGDSGAASAGDDYYDY